MVSQKQETLLLTQGDPQQLEFFWEISFSGFENLITLSVILRHLEEELSILMCLKLIRGIFPL
jgi:hypothetical protein